MPHSTLALPAGLQSRSDTIGTALIILFLVKPTLDLLWFLPFFSMAGIEVSLLHITGVLVLLYFGRYLLVYKNYSPPAIWWFRLFIILNLVSIAATMLNEPLKVIPALDKMIRILDSYIIFNVAYFAALNRNPTFLYRLVRAISIGAFIAISINFIAIVLGYEGRVVTSGVTERVSGLYYDPGVTANVAVYTIVFSIYMGNLIRRGGIGRTLYIVVAVMISLYVIYTGLSRAAFVLLCVFGIIYILFLKKGLVSRIIPPLVLAGMLLIGAFSGLDYYNYVLRFQSEINVLTEAEIAESAGDDKEVDFGKYEHIGSNRGQLVAYMLDAFIKRPLYQQIIGNYNRSPSHTDYFDVLSRTGYAGLLAYLGLLFVIWKKTLSYVLIRGNDSVEWKITVLGFTLISMYILYAFPHRPLLYTTISWFMWAVLGSMFAAIQSLGKPGNSATRTIMARGSDTRLVARKVGPSTNV